MSEEQWLPVIGFESHYSVSNFGNVKRMAPGPGTRVGKLRKLVPRNGYFQIILCVNNHVTLCWVHRLVAMAFLGAPNASATDVNHKDGNGFNNKVDNLEWVSPSENAFHAYRTGLRTAHAPVGSKNGLSKLTEADIPSIRALRGKESGRSIARRYGVSFGLISHIWHGRVWTHV